MKYRAVAQAEAFGRFTAVLVAATLLLALAGWDAAAQQTLVRAPQRAVRVPFTLRNGVIMVEATIGEKRVACVLDTGASFVTWPRALNLGGRAMGVPRTGIVDATGARREGEWTRLPVVRLGEWEFRDVPGQVLDISENDAALATPILGNTLFDNLVLTIDDRRREIVLRSAADPLSPHPRDRQIAITRLNAFPLVVKGEKRFWGGQLSVAGQAAGRPVRFLVDTGWGFKGIGLSRAFRDQTGLLPTGRTVDAAVGYGNARLDVAQTAWSLAGLSGTGDALVTPSLGGAEAAIGRELLSRFRVTIDFRRDLLLLQPYDP